MTESSKVWFPARRFGWGWGLPVAWQGWVVLGVFAGLLMVGVALLLSTQEIAGFLGYTAVLSLALLGICYMKGEPPSWRWGGK